TRVILDLKRQMTGLAAAAATLSGRPERSSPGSDEVVRQSRAKGIRFRETRDSGCLLRGSCGQERDRSDQANRPENSARDHFKSLLFRKRVELHSLAQCVPACASWQGEKGTERTKLHRMKKRRSVETLRLGAETIGGRTVRNRLNALASSEQSGRNWNSPQAIRPDPRRRL